MPTQHANTHGFKQINTTEHEFARYLRRVKAIDNWSSVSSSNIWTAPDGKTAAVCLYDNANCVCTYWIPEDMEF